MLRTVPLKLCDAEEQVVASLGILGIKWDTQSNDFGTSIADPTHSDIVTRSTDVMKVYDGWAGSHQ